MTGMSLGDLVQSHLFRQQNTRLQSDVTRLLTELTSGQTSDLGKTLNGDYTALSGIERGLSLQAAYTRASQEAVWLADGQQNALSAISDLLNGKGAALTATAAMGQFSQMSAQISDGVSNFEAVIGALNTQSGDRALFAGAATQGAALADAAQMLANLSAATAADTTAAAAMASIDAWFDTAGGGFETTGYLGSTTTLSPIAISEGQTAEISITAADPEVRNTLKAFATIALLDQGLLDGDPTEQLALLDRAGRLMWTAEGAVTDVRANLGTLQARIDLAQARNAAEEAGLLMTRDAVIGIDEYQTASRLEEAQSQIEMLYTVTARISQLSFADFLR